MSKRTNGSASPAPERKRCAVYTRKSTEEGLDQEFNSLDAQRESGEAFIASQRSQGWDCLPDRYDDGGFTGANIERPVLRRLLDDIEHGKVDAVVVYKVDRLSRSLLDFARLMEVFERRQVSFVSVTQQFNTATSMGRLVLNVLLSFAQFEREMIAERTRDKIAAARRKGKWTGGPVPLGYRVVDKKLVVEDLEAVVAREVFDLYEQHRSALAVAHALNDSKRRTKRHVAKNGNVREPKKWTKDAILRVLRNPVYAGCMPYGDEVHEGEHVALIDRDRWNRVQAALDGRKTAKHSPRTNPEYMLRGILRCARCGHAMTPASTRKARRTYRYYRCITRDKEGRHACRTRPLPADAIESFVVERIREATADGTLATDVAGKLRARAEKLKADLLTERTKLPTQIAALAAETRKLVDSIANVNPTAQRLIEQRIECVTEQLGLHEARLAEVERAMASAYETELEIGWIADTLARFDAAWDALNDENRSRLVRCLVERVEVDEPSGRVTAALVDLGLADENDDEDLAAPAPAPTMEASP
jgi:DNA invertase Pin-like site-specific DNA recombinase